MQPGLVPSFIFLSLGRIQVRKPNSLGSWVIGACRRIPKRYWTTARSYVRFCTRRRTSYNIGSLKQRNFVCPVQPTEIGTLISLFSLSSLTGSAPQFQSLVVRARHNGPSIWTESHTIYSVAVAQETLETRSTRNRPQFQSLVVRARYNGPAIWTESHTAYSVAVAVESIDTFP